MTRCAPGFEERCRAYPEAMICRRHRACSMRVSLATGRDGDCGQNRRRVRPTGCRGRSLPREMLEATVNQLNMLPRRLRYDLWKIADPEHQRARSRASL